MASSTNSLYSAGWAGLSTFMNRDLFHGKHTKMRGRPHIYTTKTGEFAEARDEDQKNRNRNYLSSGDWIREIYYSNLQFGGDEDHWQFDRVLGAGSFGMVASWKKDSGEGPIDSLVTKSETPGVSTSVHLLRPDLSNEAFTLAQLDTRRCVDGWPHMGIVQFRGYRYHHGDTSTQGNGLAFQPKEGHLDRPLYREWRTYMENCLHGNIARTIMTYKAWGYHVPEAFVWWTFFWLAQGCRAMDADTGEDFLKFVSPYETRPLPQSWMLANDIKSENCFYGSQRAQHGVGVPFEAYPAARVGDLGLAQVVRLDAWNRSRNLHGGTKVWTAPEKRKTTMIHELDGTRHYPFYDPRRVDAPSWGKTNGAPNSTGSHCIGSEANLWTVALVVYMLMTGEQIRDISKHIDWMQRPVNPSRDDHSVDKYLCHPDQFPGFLSGDEDYSPELKRLVAECCRLEPLKRPTLESVATEIARGIRQEQDRLRSVFGTDAAIADATRMAFSNEDWHDVPQGPYMMMKRPVPGVLDKDIGQAWFDFSFAVETWQDPNAPPLFVPGRTTEALPVDFPDQVRPFQGHDLLTYVNPGATSTYWKGRPLPNGGRAQRVPAQGGRATSGFPFTCNRMQM